jgi:hypothetical protein
LNNCYSPVELAAICLACVGAPSSVQATREGKTAAKAAARVKAQLKSHAKNAVEAEQAEEGHDIVRDPQDGQSGACPSGDGG